VRGEGRKRGDGRIFPRPNSSIWSCAYCVRGKEVRESTGETDERKALKYLKRRLDEIAADRIGAKQFAGPKAERIDISCGVIDTHNRKTQCDCLCCALERDFRLRSKASAPNLSLIKRLRSDFARERAVTLTSEQVDAYIERRLSQGAAPATVNRATQMLGQLFHLAIKRKRLITAPFIRHLSETANVRQGFYTAAEFEAIVNGLPQYLKHFAHFGYLTGMRSNQIKTLLWDDIHGDRIRSRAENVKNRKAHSIDLDGDLKELIEKQRTARPIPRPDGTVMLSRYVSRLRAAASSALGISA
jgi:integrase